VGVAALPGGLALAGRNTAVVVSGANIDPGVLAQVLGRP
jgi:threonine dehydratase